jgi:hypothetical protein
MVVPFDQHVWVGFCTLVCGDFRGWEHVFLVENIVHIYGEEWNIVWPF